MYVGECRHTTGSAFHKRRRTRRRCRRWGCVV